MHERDLAAALRIWEVHDKEFHRNANRLEGFLVRHWPEVTQFLDLRSATLLQLLSTFGGPGTVADHADEARKLMRATGRWFLDETKIDAVIASASSTFGVAQRDEESRVVMVIASEARRSQRLSNKAKRHVERLSASVGASAQMQAVVGKTTAAVLVAAVGDPRNYSSATAYLKSTGLNLKEKSSGKHKGALHITKRGSGIARRFLYLAVLRLIQSDPVVRAWYAKKVTRQGETRKRKAVVAVMRKLVLALWHVAKGELFDASRLYDANRLKLTATSA